jgi:hypothetical protein
VATSFLEFDGVFADGLDGRPLRRFVVNNWTDEDLHTKWLGQDALLKAGEMRECGHAEAYHFTKTLVDREIFKEASRATDTKDREKKEMNVISPLYRQPFEEKTLQEIKLGEESPIMRKMREDIEKQVRAEMSSSDGAAGITKSGVVKKGEFEE